MAVVQPDRCHCPDLPQSTGDESDTLSLKTKHRIRVLKGGNEIPHYSHERADDCKLMVNLSQKRLHMFWFAVHTGLNNEDIYHGEWGIFGEHVHVTTGKNDYREGRAIPVLFHSAMIGLQARYQHGPADNHSFYNT